MYKKKRSGAFSSMGITGHERVLHALCVFRRFLISAFKNASSRLHLPGVKTTKQIQDVLGVNVLWGRLGNPIFP